MKLKINNVRGHSGVVTIQTDANGVPLAQFWRKRLKDAERDNCVEIVKKHKPIKPTEEVTE